MTAAELTWALLAGGSFLAAGAVFSLRVKKAFFGEWRGSIGLTSVVLIGICWALVLGQLLGAVGWLRSVPLLVAAAASAAGAELAWRRRPVAGRPASSAAPEPSPPEPAGDALRIATVLVVLLVAALWVARTVIALRRGINDPDSVGYHLPFAATFAQTGFADQHRFVFPFLPIHFYPANEELLSAIALVLTRSVAFAAVKNLVFGGLVLVAAHAVGKAGSAAWLAVGGAATALGLPVVAFSQTGEAVNDTFVLLTLLGGLAVLAHGVDRPAAYVLAMTCAGVAYGTKFSAVVPGVALGALALWLLRARVPTHRLRAAAVGVLASLALGGSWYLRNALAFSNPIPPARLGIGSFHLPQIATDAAQYSFSVAWYLVRATALRQLWRGMGQGVGPLFLAVLGAMLVGVVAGLRSKDRFRRGLAVVVLVTGVGYLTTPASAYGSRGNPEGFVINLHYAAPVLLVGLVAAGLALQGWRWAWTFPLGGAVVAATSVAPGRRISFWAPEIGGRGYALLVVAAVAGAVVAWMWIQPRLRRPAQAAAAATAVLAAVGVGVIARHYPRLSETDPVRRWAATARPTRIAGWVPEVALLHGPGAQNRVVTLTRLVDGAPVALDSCPAWMEALRQGRFPFTAVVPKSEWQRWLDADPAFEVVANNQRGVAVYRVAGEPDADCSRPG